MYIYKPIFSVNFVKNIYKYIHIGPEKNIRREYTEMLSANSQLIDLKMNCDCLLSRVFEFPIMETYYFRNQKKGNKHNFENLRDF